MYIMFQVLIDELGGRQYFTDPRIGDFSITFTERDGKGQGEGLTTPILQLKDVGDWKEFPVSALADLKAFKDEGCMPGFPCPDGPYICTHSMSHMSSGLGVAG